MLGDRRKKTLSKKLWETTLPPRMPIRLALDTLLYKAGETVGGFGQRRLSLGGITVGRT